jgi:uncharacterized protein (UPF0210 family)
LRPGVRGQPGNLARPHFKNEKRRGIRYIPALGKLRQENFEFKAILGYMAKPCLQKKKKKRGGWGEE